MRMALIQWFSPEFRTLEVSPLCSGKKALQRAVYSYWWLTPPSIVPAAYLELEEEEPQQTSHLLTPPPLQAHRDQGKQLGNLRRPWPLLDWGNRKDWRGPEALNQLLSSGYTGALCPLGLSPSAHGPRTLMEWPGACSPAVPATHLTPAEVWKHAVHLLDMVDCSVRLLLIISKGQELSFINV